MKKIIQLQYTYNPDKDNTDSSSYLEDSDKKPWITGEIFSNYTPIVQLGIQTLPGVKFYVNGNVYPITIGVTGIYEIDSSCDIMITSLRFDGESLKMIEDSPITKLIVDIIYEEEEEQ